ncbi:MAG TPA: hypothetical protein VFS32_02035 [Candidatus Limnocylindrales bacterium]|nr:hypothetical protein [Candidatus Limnocylindrales bacterium]
MRAELSVAARLLADRRFELAYEPYGSGRLGPDFGVTFRAGLAFNLEVTRPRPRPDGVDVGRAVVAKIRQMPPSVANVLLLDVGAGSPAALDVAGAIRALRQAVDARDTAVLSRLEVATPRAFYERFLRLAAVVARSEPPPAATLWANPSARIALPDAAGRALMTTLGDGAGEGR